MVASEFELTTVDRSVTRLPQWDVRLHAYLEETKTQARVWGQTDCAIWSMGAVDAMCGTSLAAEFRGRYRDATSARVYLDARGWANLGEAVVERVGPALPSGAVHVTMGDLIYTPTDDGLGGLGILFGRVILPHHDTPGFRSVLLKAVLLLGGFVVPLGEQRCPA